MGVCNRELYCTQTSYFQQILTENILTRRVDKNLQSFSSFGNIWLPMSPTLFTHSTLLVSMAIHSCSMIGNSVWVMLVRWAFIRQTNLARNFQQRRIREGSKVIATLANWISMERRRIKCVWSMVTRSVPSRHSYILLNSKFDSKITSFSRYIVPWGERRKIWKEHSTLEKDTATH